MSTTTETGSIRVTGIDLSAYMTTDLDRALAFYRTIGLEPTTVYPEQAGAEFTFADGSTFGLWNPRGAMPFQPASGVMLAVEDFPTTLDVLQARGIPIEMQNESPVCFMAIVTDPDGNRVILHKRKPGND